MIMDGTRLDANPDGTAPAGGTARRTAGTPHGAHASMRARTVLCLSLHR
jgi:hypothetical protein